MPSAPNFTATLSTLTDPVAAAADASARARAAIGGRRPSLAVLFVSPQLCTDPWAVIEEIHTRLEPDHLIGCTAEAVIGEGREVERSEGLSLWCAALPDVAITTFRLVSEPASGGDAFAGWPDGLHAWGDDTPLIMLADPFTFPADALLAEHNAGGLPPIIGGLASGGARPGEHVMFHDAEVHFDGAVGVALPGAPIVPVVSQGCAPIGPDMVVTAGGGPVVAELAGISAFEKITEVVDQLPADERELLQQPLLAGLVIDENKPEYARGDFLVRGIHGRDPETGAVYIGENVRVGQTFRLHVRDSASADADLRIALRDAVERAGALRPVASLVFSCNGRGTRMFDVPDHDASTIANEIGVPTAGMFCNGEIGPVGGRTFLHGFTATMALFLDADEPGTDDRDGS